MMNEGKNSEVLLKESGEAAADPAADAGAKPDHLRIPWDHLAIQERERPGFRPRRLVANFFALIAAAFFLLGLGGSLSLLGYDVFVWLRTGVWSPFEILDAMTWIIPAGSGWWAWFEAPQSWHGFHTIVAGFFGLPLFIGVFSAGMVVATTAGILSGNLED